MAERDDRPFVFINPPSPPTVRSTPWRGWVHRSLPGRTPKEWIVCGQRAMR